MNCEMCGKETYLFKAVIEGTQLNVCKECARFGKIMKKISAPVKEKKKKEENIEEEPEIIEIIVPDYAKRVKKARENLGLKQEEIAMKINEKESVIHKVETGHYKPSLRLAKKLGRFLKIDLIEKQKIEKEKKKDKDSSSGMTIGDLIKIKKS